MASSFFVILLDPCARHLPLPPLENKFPEGPVTVLANGGYWWSLRIKKMGGTYCFANGWHNVVKDIQLCLGDFLYFQPLDQSTFRMSVHSPNGCEKTLPPKVEHVVSGSSGVDEGHDKGDDPYFTLIITKTLTSLLRFPVEFARSARMDAERTMALKNLDGEEWNVCLRVEMSHGTKRHYLSTGWHDFQQQNGISEGDECVIKFVKSEGKLLLEKITK